MTQSNSLVLGSIKGVNNASVDTNVGIGTTAPSARLEVKGDVKFSGNMSGINNMVMGSGTPLPVWSGNVELNNEAGVGFHFRALSTEFDIGPGAGDPVHPAYPSLLTLFWLGNVGIGTANPHYKLHVAGSIYATGSYLGSDARLKQNVLDLTYGLREVMRLRPVSYEWKDRSDGKVNLGLIAQEVEPVIPELVEKAKGKAGLMSLNYIGLIPVLVKAIQEQQTTIRDQQGMIGEQQAALERKDAEIATIKSQNAALDARLTALERIMEHLVRQEGRQDK